MEQKPISNYQFTPEKIYKEKEIWVGTLLGGVLAAGYMVAQNYKAFGETDKVRKTWFVTVAATAFLFYVSFFAPYLDRVPTTLFNLVWAGIIVVLAQIYQGEKIRAHIRAGRHIHSWWKTLGVSAIGFGITAIMVLGLAALLTAVEQANTVSKNYGTVQHEIAYDKSNISEAEVDRIAEGFIKTGLFDEYRTFVYARKIGNDYELSISVLKTALESSDNEKWFIGVRRDMQALFPDNKIVLNLVVDSYDNVIKRLE